VTTYSSRVVTLSLTRVFFCKVLTMPKKFSVLDLLAANGGGVIVTYMLLIGKAAASSSHSMNAGNTNALTRLTTGDGTALGMRT
jgi:hypothetical protein